MNAGKRIQRLVGWVALTLLGAAATPGIGRELIRDGRTDYAIVVGEGAAPPERFAAEELASHLRQMSGAEFPVRVSEGALPDRAIVLGFGREAEALGVKADEKLGTDGYVIRTVGDRLVIAGGRPRGTLYGVYSFLHSLGVRWWTPTESFVPDQKTVVVPDTDLRQIPRLEYRDLMFNELWSPAGKLWMARNRVNGMTWESLGEKTGQPGPDKLGDRYRFVGNLVHSYLRLLQKSGMPITEDMMSLVNGKRTSGESSQPCLSNEKVFEAMVRGVLKSFEEVPDAGFVVVGQMDNGNYCRCPDCAAIDEAEESHAGQVIRFANRVAEAVEKARPGSAISTAAYGWSRKPPKSLKPRDNVYITLCPIECDFAHPLADGSSPENLAFKEDIEGWSKIARKLIIWHYVGNRDHYLQPNAELETLVPNLRFFAEHGAAGIFNQGTHLGSATDMTMLKQWVLARAMWDLEADGRALIEEFCRGYYGPAGEDVLKYIDVIHAPARTERFHNGRRVHLAIPYLRPDVLAEAIIPLRAAAAKVAADSDFGRRVRHASMGVWYVLAKRGPGSATWKAVEAKLGEKLDLTVIAGNLARVVKESGVNAICDPHPVAPWLEWLSAYAAKAQELGGPVLPPELQGAPPGSFRLVQANQLDMTPSFWKPVPGASDGYAAVITGPGWHTTYHLSPGEDFSVGKSYTLYVRVRGEMKDNATGPAWEFGIHPGGATVRVEAEKLADGQWHVFSLGPWTPKDTQRFWTALVRNPGAVSAAVDCIWLVEAPAP